MPIGLPQKLANVYILLILYVELNRRWMMLDTTNGPRPLLKKTTQDLGKFPVAAAERCASSLNIPCRSPSSFLGSRSRDGSIYIYTTCPLPCYYWRHATENYDAVGHFLFFYPLLHFLTSEEKWMAGRTTALGSFCWLRPELHECRQRKKGQKSQKRVYVVACIVTKSSPAKQSRQVPCSVSLLLFSCPS